MVLLKKYRSVKGFLERFTIVKIGNLHIRTHILKTKDESSFYHNHPFNYISIILKGGYRDSHFGPDKVIKFSTYKRFSFIFRKFNVYHKIEEIFGETTTLFISYGKYDWKIINLNDPKEPDGIYLRNVNNNNVWAKRLNDVWFIGNKNKKIAEKETRYSINQITK